MKTLAIFGDSRDTTIFEYYKEIQRKSDQINQLHIPCDIFVYNGHTGPAKTDDSGPVITVINGPLFTYNYRCLFLMAQLFFSSKRFSLQFDPVGRENNPVEYGISCRTFSN